MINRTLRIALVVSLGIHIFWMTAVTIIAPGSLKRKKPYTRVDFLGPILKKTAFDIMLDNVSSGGGIYYSDSGLFPGSDYLEVAVPKRRVPLRKFPAQLESNMDALVLDFLSPAKVVPDLTLGPGDNRFAPGGLAGGDVLASPERQVIYSPEPPYVVAGLYGYEDRFVIRARALVDARGKVKKVEPLTTTGYPELDLAAAKYARGWIFEPSDKAAGEDEWVEIEVVLEAGEK